ncbi:PLP-dependent aminotransferase family protein [Kocuria palustris]|uniref:MocR-like pyridoxine biosynthesis transcription factor PdxR n=1 Tax=Kocuria palustris TaxID=71999 RepID=UPI0019D0B2A7|nr:PLP-dependent aminotransferase family protein [Kocuria palustris]MBN6752874.1 PLP-dependent aminotransferase family protein [Kocuria palustris]MBN6757869.1 PLP-dependent aminotransferase family protein [Kocuria palustris]MBN6762897.1 PLP-dependent aminotransferase family protein [Kocuria palustris]MBN6782562.1 PLP-dependent aminotransferase family protein [Kocuria palustris]MBN6799296.1 PLP-dependent aminotransferase family protein [Kocuria palustris]
MTARSSVELTVVLERSGALSLPVQLADGIRSQVASRALAPGDALPSTRLLASRLGVSRGTVVSAYDQLIGEGYLRAEQGRPTTVHPGLERIHPSTPASLPGSAPSPSPGSPSSFGPAPRTSGFGEGPIPHPAPVADDAVDGLPVREEHLLDLRPGQPDTSRVEGPAWRAAWRHAAGQPLPVRPDPAGQDVLRRASAEHLRLMRALPASPDRLVITAGAREGLSLLLGTLSARSGRARLRVGVETPGYPTLRAAVEALGHERVACPVDDDGLRVDLLPAGDDAPDVLIVTPSHQYPLGGSLSLQRRLELLEWAQRHDVLIVEDDFDSELRYVGAPLPTLSALDPTGASVALLGTFSALLSPALATGYLVLPDPWLDPVLERRRQLGVPVSALTQAAIAHLLDSGYLRRHTRRMRSVYARRRDRIRAAFAETRRARLAPMHGGVDVVITTDDEEAAVVGRCRDAGLLVGRRSAYWSAASPLPSEASDVDCADRSDCGIHGGSDGEVAGDIRGGAGGRGGGGIVVGFARTDDEVLTRVLPQLVAACEGRPSPPHPPSGC